MGCIAGGCGLRRRCVIFNGPAIFGKEVGMTRPSVSDSTSLGLSSVKLRPCCGAARGVGHDFLGSRTVRGVVTAIVKRVRRPLSRALSPGLVTSRRLVSLASTLQGVRFPSGPRLLQGTRCHLGFRRLFCMRLGVLQCTGSQRHGCHNCIFRAMKRVFGAFCSGGLPFRLANTRGEILERVERSMKYKGRVGQLLRKSIKDKGALITLVDVLVTLSGKFRTYVVTPARVLTGRRCSAVERLLFKVSMEIRLLANSMGNGGQRTVLTKLLAKSMRVLVNARTIVRSAMGFTSLKLTIVSRRRHFKITRHTHL